MTRGSAWWKGSSCFQVAAPGPNSARSGATGITCSCAIERLGPQRALDPVLRLQQGASQRPRQVLSPESQVARVPDVLRDYGARAHPLDDRDGDLGLVPLPDRQKAFQSPPTQSLYLPTLLHLLA